MTVTDMIDQVELLLGDPYNRTYNADSHIRPALDMAVNELVGLIIGYAQRDKRAFSLLDAIQTTYSVAMDSDGEDIRSDLSTGEKPLFSIDGIVGATYTTDSVTRDVVIKRPEYGEETHQNNYYLAGTDREPVLTIMGSVGHIDCTNTASPAIVFTYVRKPKALITDGADTDTEETTCSLDVALHYLVVDYAVGICKRMVGNNEDYMVVRKEIERKLQQLIQGSYFGNTTENVGGI